MNIKSLLFVLGFISLVLGLIGIILPLLPTTPFILLSSVCFAKSSPRVHKWLTSIPAFGDAIIDWERHRRIKTKAKVLALVMITLSIGATLSFSTIPLIGKVTLACVGFAVSCFIALQRSV